MKINSPCRGRLCIIAGPRRAASSTRAPSCTPPARTRHPATAFSVPLVEVWSKSSAKATHPRQDPPASPAERTPAAQIGGPGSIAASPRSIPSPGSLDTVVPAGRRTPWQDIPGLVPVPGPPTSSRLEDVRAPGRGCCARGRPPWDGRERPGPGALAGAPTGAHNAPMLASERGDLILVVVYE